MPDNQPEWKRFLGEYAAAFFVALSPAMDWHHPSSGVGRGIFAAMVAALPLAAGGHFLRKLPKGARWKFGALFAAVLGLGFLHEWQRPGHSDSFHSIYSAPLSLAIWITAAFILISYIWLQAEGQGESLEPLK